ncbi:protein of unknown function (plasmid) [Cupriavidus taiwanensis]|uniref:Uncharacterized protein n=1 Tax=Cupriavidus taiwanensis TaxID=164546 RepID=A0A375EF12_9BURK|nr:protein of unknown function [Cupriavidus taiwanensis]SOZ72363.1 protein of unknown function [Cupriavidus taiwanensis]SOZ74682.1 protein of unknown function [Cupriavidus taiwanensis]SPA03568.1 protein of unknown function [Cupriavidus taiwanensis]SPA11467.1 protein of unknown function [Cupriavidus taiwanensis]
MREAWSASNIAMSSPVLCCSAPFEIAGPQIRNTSRNVLARAETGVEFGPHSLLRTQLTYSPGQLDIADGVLNTIPGRV